MFKKQQRYSFRGALPSQYLNTNLFSLRYEKNNDKGLRCAVVVGKKVDKKAHVRNTVKRRFTHALKEEIGERQLPYNLVFFLRSQGKQVGFPAMKEEIKNALEKTNII